MIAHPVITLAAIVLTANHYWLDAVVATVLFAFALVVDWLLERRRKRRLVRAEVVDGGTDDPAALGAGSSTDPAVPYRPRPRLPAGSSAVPCRRTRSPH